MRQTMPRDKRMSPEEMAAQIKSGSTIMLGGFGSVRKPMAIVRALAASDVEDLTVISVAGGLETDLLIATGKAKRVVYSYVGLDQGGLAPHFRRGRQAGTLEAYEGSEYTMIAGLEAAAKRLPFLPVRSGLGSDLLRVNPTYKIIESPFKGEKLVAVPPLEADYALLHVNYADIHGWGHIVGDGYVDALYAKAAKKVFVSAEKIVPTEQLNKLPGRTEILRILVTGVCEIPYGAHPTSCYPNYSIDLAALGQYQFAAKKEETMAAYLNEYVKIDHQTYLKNTETLRAELTTAVNS